MAQARDWVWPSLPRTLQTSLLNSPTQLQCGPTGFVFVSRHFARMLKSSWQKNPRAAQRSCGIPLPRYRVNAHFATALPRLLPRYRGVFGGSLYHAPWAQAHSYPGPHGSFWSFGLARGPKLLRPRSFWTSGSLHRATAAFGHQLPRTAGPCGIPLPRYRGHAVALPPLT